MKRLREILSAIFPVSAKCFHENILEITSSIDKTNGALIELSSTVDAINAEILEAFETYNQNLDNLSITLDDTKNMEIIFKEFARLKRLANTGLETYLYYENSDKQIFDKTLISSFQEFRSRPDFEAIFLNLTRGLDDKSKQVVVRILARIDVIANAKGPVDIFTREEKDELRSQKEYTGSNIVKISDNCYCMGEYMLPANKFLPSVFSDRMCISQFRNIAATSNKHIIDVGAFIGDSAIIFSKLTSKNVHCFEPMSENYNLLERTISLNGLSNVISIKSAVGNINGKQSFAFIGSGLGSRLATHPDETTEEVPVVTLDSYVQENNLEVGLIKVDVEGAEQMFLEGARETIFSQKPMLIISIYHNAEDFFLIKPMIESWNLGYKFKIHKPTLQSIITDTELIAEVI